ncbi:hypothetical protein THRCLA_11773 [Thraustotheca clavata]|uniref:Fe2OG dioxygenase domain-containing protein n=1 Tax=Thraustotheca clavata TaxID=74557 RepID=A0A1V9Y6Q7_9STRA|nr:hypothetical protein THRCLA_11773 [Thraustotheca clavata]
MNIPTVDCFAPDASDQLRKACIEVGFFYLKNHGISKTLIDAVYTEMHHFFQQPLTEKNKVLANENMRGYTPMNEETLDPAVQTQGDTKEGYYICREAQSDELHLPLHGTNVFPDPTKYPTFKATTTKYFDQMNSLGFHVAQLFAKAAGSPGTFDHPGMFDRPMAALRLLHYNDHVSDVDNGVFGAGAHSDYGLLTLLSTDDTPGLEIYHNESWIQVPPRSDCFIVNIGDLGGRQLFGDNTLNFVERWTNGLFKSTRHRVVNRVGRERYSIPFFYEPNFTCVVKCLPSCISPESPAKYPPITSGEHLLSKYRETHDSYKA